MLNGFLVQTEVFHLQNAMSLGFQFGCARRCNSVSAIWPVLSFGVEIMNNQGVQICKWTSTYAL